MFVASIVTFVYLAILIVVPILVGVYVFRDASRRGMNAALWTLIAVLVPILVGFIIYLLVRGNYPDLKCPQCGTPVRESYVSCPQCGARLKASCPSCSAPVEPDWKVCPRCASPPVSGFIQHSDSCKEEGPGSWGGTGGSDHCPLGSAAVLSLFLYRPHPQFRWRQRDHPFRG